MKVILIFLVLLVPMTAQDKGKPGGAQTNKTNVITVPAGVTLTVRVNEAISSKKNDVGDRFTGVLETAVSANGAVVAERLSSVTGRVAGKRRSAQGDELSLEVVSIECPKGEVLPVVTDPMIRRHENSAATGPCGWEARRGWAPRSARSPAEARGQRLEPQLVGPLAPLERQRRASPSK